MDLGKIRILPTLTPSDKTTGEILILNTHNTHSHTEFIRTILHVQKLR